jgi:hypothetical protein
MHAWAGLSLTTTLTAEEQQVVKGLRNHTSIAAGADP